MKRYVSGIVKWGKGKWATSLWRGRNEWKSDWRDILVFGKCYSTSHCTFQDLSTVSVPSSLTHESKQFPKHDKHSNLHLGMLKLKLQYFGHLIWRVDSLEKTLMLGGIGGRRRRERQRMKWLDAITDWVDMCFLVLVINFVPVVSL